MVTISQQLAELVNQKKSLEDILIQQGVDVGENETFNTLIPKVAEIGGVEALL